MIYETDTDKVLVYSGSAWIEITDITNAASNIMQRNVQSTTLASTLTLSSAAADTYYDATGLSVNITPTSSSSKILVMVDLSASMAGGADARAFFRLVRDSTAVGGGTASGNRPSASKGFYEGNSVTVENSISWTYLDSPNTTSSVTYKIQYAKSSTALVMYLNRTGGDPDLASQPRTSSTITVMEIPV
jgi:hypothetical protein